MSTRRNWFWSAAAATALSVGACSDSDSGSEPVPACSPSDRNCKPNESPSEPGTMVSLALNSTDQAALGELQSELAELPNATAESLLGDHPVTFTTDLGFDPKTAKGLELIQATQLALDPSELDTLGRQGFAISARQKFPNMGFGLKTIYSFDLPVYVSIDPILEAIHGSYSAILKRIEAELLLGDLRTLLTTARKRNAELTKNDQTRKDLDFFLSVALGLLEGRAQPPAASADATMIATFVRLATEATGIQKIALFGVPRQIDFSQFTPRGHYVDSPELTRYFQAMMWLGRTDFRLIETQPDGSSVFHRRQLEAVVAMREAVRDEAAAAYARIDAVVTAFVGGHDYLQIDEIDALTKELGVASPAELAALTDQQIAQTIIDKGYGAQRIASQVIFKETISGTFPLDRSFALLGQRYIVDSHVFSDVVYDRVPATVHGRRLLPDPLDAAYAALGNSAALPLLREELDTYAYAPNLERMRVLVDAHDAKFWDENIYNAWLSALRALSPDANAQTELPTVARTEAWSRRILNTQLGSWSQLRHDTILYAKQSYTSGIACEFPDAYVDPYPEAFGRIAALAARGKAAASVLTGDQSSQLAASVVAYFDELASVANILRDMAEQQQKGVPFNAAQMAFINDAVKTGVTVCGGPTPYEGWYARLLYTRDDSTMKPTIADVHTDPGGLGGEPPPQVLHVAAGLPRFMVLTVNTCNGPRAYAGVTFAYHQVVPEGLKRLNDMDWAGMASQAEDVAWMKPVLQ